jgi:hypothetical protein
MLYPNPAGSGCTVAQSMLRFNQIKAGRRWVGLGLGLTFFLLGGGALARMSVQDTAQVLVMGHQMP